ncbi:hypothetical protein [Escherichia coli]|nr:hypothetical protein [Escherichia coli]
MSTTIHHARRVMVDRFVALTPVELCDGLKVVTRNILSPVQFFALNTTQ